MAGIRGIRIERPKIGGAYNAINATKRMLERELEEESRVAEHAGYRHHYRFGGDQRGTFRKMPMLLEKKELLRKILDLEIREPSFVDSSRVRALFRDVERRGLRTYLQQRGVWKIRRETVGSAVKQELTEAELAKVAHHFKPEELEILRKRVRG